jgi:hypothetical protein
MADLSEGQLKLLEKLLSDTDFRTSFFADPDAALAGAGFELNREELAGLKGLVDLNLLGSSLTDLDARLSKTSVGGLGLAGGTGAAGTGSATAGLVGNIANALTTLLGPSNTSV